MSFTKLDAEKIKEFFDKEPTNTKMVLYHHKSPLSERDVSFEITEMGIHMICEYDGISYYYEKIEYSIKDALLTCFYKEDRFPNYFNLTGRGLDKVEFLEE